MNCLSKIWTVKFVVKKERNREKERETEWYCIWNVYLCVIDRLATMHSYQSKMRSNGTVKIKLDLILKKCYFGVYYFNFCKNCSFFNCNKNHHIVWYIRYTVIDKTKRQRPNILSSTDNKSTRSKNRFHMVASCNIVFNSKC